MSVLRCACGAVLVAAVFSGCSQQEAEPPAKVETAAVSPPQSGAPPATPLPAADPFEFESPEEAFEAACRALEEQDWQALSHCLGAETVNVTAGQLLAYLLSGAADLQQVNQTLQLLEQHGVNEDVVAAVEQRAGGDPHVARRELLACVNNPKSLLAGLLALVPPVESPFASGMTLTELRPYREMAFARVMYADEKRWEPIEFRQTAGGWRIDLPTGLRCVPATPEPQPVVAKVEVTPRIEVPVEPPPITEEDRAQAVTTLQSLGTVQRDEQGNAVAVQIDAEQLADAHFAALGMLTELRQIDLCNSRDLLSARTSISAAQLSHLAKLPKLESLRLKTYALDAAGLESIGQLSSLKELYLTDRDDVPLSAASLEHLGRLSQLQRLSLSARLEQRGLQHLAGLAQLEWLYLGRGCPVRIDPGLVDTLRRLPALRSLYVYVEESSLEQVSRLGSLRGLASLSVVLLDQPGEEVRALLRESLANARVDVTSYR